MKGRIGSLRIGPLCITMVIPLLVGFFSAFLTSEDMKSYEQMYHPPLAPPAWVFPVAWTILYLMMGFASYLAATAEADPAIKRKALLFYAAQLAMNFFWSTLFFTYKRYLIAFIWIMAMWVLVLICTIRFFRLKRAAGLMMGALLLWTSFAAYLNFAAYRFGVTGRALFL